MVYFGDPVDPSLPHGEVRPVGTDPDDWSHPARVTIESILQPYPEHSLDGQITGLVENEARILQALKTRP